jgi:putative membrane protein
MLTIKNYSEHAANERTFAAWLRTGMAVFAFGIVIEKLNFFLAALMESMPPQGSAQSALGTYLARLRPYEGLGLSLLGVVIIVLGGIRFLRTARAIDDTESSAARGSGMELGLATALALLAAALWMSLALQ